MRNLDKVSEIVLKRSDREEVDKEFSNYGEAYLKDHPIARIIVVKKTRFVHGYLLSDDEFLNEEDGRFGERNDFKEFLVKWEPKNFADLLIILAFYYRRTIDMEVLKQYPAHDPVIDSILADSRGHLLFFYQLEKLIGLFAEFRGHIT